MTKSCADVADPFFCPDKWALFAQIMANLRPGRATQTNWDTVEIAEAEGDVWPPDNPWAGRLTPLQQYWAAVAEVLAYLHARACALIPEMFCSTIAETRREWEIEYGFPDPCEAYDDLCEKVNAIGGTRCEYFVAIAARRGWDVTCLDCAYADGSDTADCGAADCAGAACDPDCGPDTIFITINLATSPAYSAPEIPPSADCAVADCTVVCDPNVENLKCLIERVKPAHVRAIYIVS